MSKETIFFFIFMTIPFYRKAQNGDETGLCFSFCFS